jgi:hypothetical protein
MISIGARGRPFKKGESGNPGGRPKVTAELRALARGRFVRDRSFAGPRKNHEGEPVDRSLSF